MKDSILAKESDNTSINEDTQQQKGNNSSNFVDQSPQAQEAQNLQELADSSQEDEMQWQDNIGKTASLPSGLLKEIEQATGLNLNQVKVHYNSPLPAKIQAKAFAEYPNIYIGPGYEDCLDEEAWHLAQQLQGKVKPTGKEDGVPVNDDTGLEEEARQGKVESTPVSGEMTPVIQKASLNDYNDNTKPEHDPSKISDATIKATDEYIMWEQNFINDVLKSLYTTDDLLLACRLAIRELREAGVSKDLTNSGATYLAKAKNQGDVADKAESFKDNLEWNNQGVGMQHTDFGKWIVGNGPEPNATTGILNCWELVLFSAYKSGILAKSRIEGIYNQFNTDMDPKQGDRGMDAFDNFDVLRSGGEYVYDKDNPSSPKPLKGDIVIFKDFPSHVAIATGKTTATGEVEIMSLWTQNNKKTFKTTVEVLLKDPSASGPIKFFTPNW